MLARLCATGRQLRRRSLSFGLSSGQMVRALSGVPAFIGVRRCSHTAGANVGRWVAHVLKACTPEFIRVQRGPDNWRYPGDQCEGIQSADRLWTGRLSTSPKCRSLDADWTSV